MATGKTVTTDTTTISLRRLDRQIIEIPIVGVTPLIVQRWSEKSRQQMLTAQQTTARQKKEPKDPEACYEASKYRLLDGRDGFPATAFKAAIVHAARLFEGVTQVSVKQSVLVLGDGQDDRGDQLIALSYDEVRMREDTPRNASGTPDLRYRAQYWPWRALLRVQVISSQFDEGSFFALVDAAGIGGVGEWRPTSPKSATGSYGTFRVDI